MMHIDKEIDTGNELVMQEKTETSFVFGLKRR